MRLKNHSVIIKHILLVLSLILAIVSIAMLIFNFDAAEREHLRENIVEPADPDYHVLFISSYSPVYESYTSQVSGIENGLYKNNITYDVVSMDTKNYGTREDVDDFYDFLSKRLSKNNVHYDAVLLGDDSALTFALAHQNELFNNIPMVFFGVNNQSLAERAVRNPYITGFLEKTYLEETIDTAIKLMPEATKVTAIYDSTPTGSACKLSFYSTAYNYPDYDFDVINFSYYDKEGFKERISKIGDDTILIFMVAFTDKDGNYYTIADNTQFIVESSNVPVFRNFKGGEGQGIMGGTQMDFYEQCENAALLVADILNDKKDISEMGLDDTTKGLTIYDYNVLKKYGLDIEELPDDAIIYNMPFSFFNLHKDIIIPTIIFLLSLLMIIISSQLNFAHLKMYNLDLQNAQSQLKYTADHDRLLDIYNRNAAENKLYELQESNTRYSVMLMDIDNFKAINETYGHETGDKYLYHVAKGLKKYAFNNNYFIARFGGDEFIMILPDTELNEDSSLPNEIESIFQYPMTVGMEQLSSTASIGIVNSDDQFKPSQMFVNADMALSAAKAKGKNTFAIFEGDMVQKVVNINKTRTKIVEAIENNGFYMLYQPKVDSYTLEVVGYEALVRMKDNSVYPGVFIPVAEQSGLIGKIGRITTELSIRQLAKWREEGIELKPISVNFSSNQMNDYGFINFLKSKLIEYRIDASLIEIEITEGLFLQKSWQTEKLFDQFQEMGVKLLMDDFGTGYSSLSYLTYIPVDILKLDKSLVDTYLVEDKDFFIRDVINLSHDLDKKIIIEGVEEYWQYERLKEFGADVIQGYYFSKPLSADEAKNFKVELKK